MNTPAALKLLRARLHDFVNVLGNLDGRCHVNLLQPESGMTSMTFRTICDLLWMFSGEFSILARCHTTFVDVLAKKYPQLETLVYNADTALFDKLTNAVQALAFDVQTRPAEG